MAERTTHLGKYRLLEKLGAGTTGQVYKAVQEPLGRTVAVKVLSPVHLRDEAARGRFEREARIAVTLNHPHIVRGLDFGEADGRHFFAMEFVDGRSVADRIADEGRIGEREVFRILREAAEGLEHAAEYDLVHRDVKPQNILLTSRGEAKLCDLGLASVAPLTKSDPSVETVAVGTPHYMAPERIRGKEDAGRRSDVYSLGATGYHMLTGSPPFPGRTVADIARMHLEQPARDPREIERGISGAAAAVILKMLAKDPAHRYGLHAKLIEDLRAVETGRPPLHAIRLGQGPGGSRRLRRRRSLTPLLLIVFLLAAVAGAAFLIIDPFGRREPVAEPEPVANSPGPDGGNTSVVEPDETEPPPIEPARPEAPTPDPTVERAEAEAARRAAELEAEARTERERAEGREREESAFRAAVLRAVASARRGDTEGAIGSLENEAENLQWYREDLAGMAEVFGEAQRFRAAVREGALTHKGRHLALDVLTAPDRSLHGLVYDWKDGGIEVATGGLRRLLPYDDLTPGCRLRLAFAVMDTDAPADRAAAGSEFLIAGLLSAAGPEIDAARAGGRNVELLSSLLSWVGSHEREECRRIREEHSALAGSGDRDGAFAKVEAGILQFPANADLRMLLGEELASQGEHARAVTEFSRARGLGSEEPGVALGLGRSHLALGDEKAAEAELLAAVEHSAPGSDVARLGEELLRSIRERRREARALEVEAKADAARRDKDHSKAARLYEQLFEIDPARTIALFHAGTARVKARELVAGYRNLRRYLSAAESGPRILEAKRAVRALEKKHRDVKGVPELVARAEALLEVEKAEEAEAIFADAARVAPLHPDARHGRARALLALHANDGNRKRLSAALAEFTAAAEIDPELAEAAEGRILCLLELGEPEEAERAAMRSLARNANRWELWNLAGRAALAREDAATAVERFGEGINRAPEEAELYINRAVAYDALGRSSSARKDLEKAQECRLTRAQIERIGEIRQGLRR